MTVVERSHRGNKDQPARPSCPPAPERFGRAEDFHFLGNLNPAAGERPANRQLAGEAAGDGAAAGCVVLADGSEAGATDAAGEAEGAAVAAGVGATAAGTGALIRRS